MPASREGPGSIAAKPAATVIHSETVNGFKASPEWRRRHVRTNLLAVSTAILGVATALSWLNARQTELEFDFSRTGWIVMLLLAAATALCGVLWYAVRAQAHNAYQDRLDREIAQRREERDQALLDPASSLERRLEANRELLNLYQLPVREQARTSYLAAQIVAAVGFLVLLVGAGVTLATSEPSLQVSVAALTAVGAALSGYVTRTFLRVYEHAQSQLNFYFREPLVTNYLLNAERLAENLEGERREKAFAEMSGELVRSLARDLVRTPPFGTAKPDSRDVQDAAGNVPDRPS